MGGLRRYSLIAMCFGCSVMVAAGVALLSPIHYKMTLAGNFGEFRPNHFHGGIDIKTEHMEGKPIYSVGEGYIYKVSVGVNGFGKAVYVRHPNGLTSVYGHLRDFSPRIRARVRRVQQQQHNDTCEVVFRPGQMPVAANQFIAFSGNTGASQGPHLHLEIHRTKDDVLMDPLEYLRDCVADHVAPRILAYKAYPVRGEGIFRGMMADSLFRIDSLTQLSAWGKVGFGIRAEDYMDSIPNRYGIRHTHFYVDDKLVFESDVNGIPIADHPQVNIWGDYFYFLQNRHWFMKTFIEPGNTLPILKADANKGYVVFNQQRPYLLRFELSDIYGNTTTSQFTVVGKP